jgi:hypothetical protein
MEEFKIFAVGFPMEKEYIVAQTKEEALKNYMNRAGYDQDHWDVKDIEVDVIPFDKVGRFETEEGWKEMTFREFLGDDFVYTGPELICWNE